MKSGKILLLALLVFLSSCGSKPEPAAPAPPALKETPVPAQPGAMDQPMNIPATNPMTVEKVALGKQLFFDTRLSKTGNMSCETCHLPDKGWTDGKALSPKFDGSMNTRHTPTLINVGFQQNWYWDGRAKTLEGQVTAAWRGQMGADEALQKEIATKLNGIEAYKRSFEEATGGPATPESIAKVLATFVRSLRSENSPWDRYEKGDKSAVSEDAVAGFDVFSNTNKANCTLCHVPPLYTDVSFHNTGIGFDKPMPDQGRGKILADAATAAKTTDPQAKEMMGAFKTPTLRSITESGPYFHDGRSETLEDAVDLLLRGGIRAKNPTIDAKLKPKKLAGKERDQLLAFLKSLTPESKPFEKPQIP